MNKGRGKKTLLQKGFTLVELMVVVAIVGILSAVALPSFLSQSVKAKGTECAQKTSAIFRQVSAEKALSATKADALASSLSTSESATGNCTIAVSAVNATTGIATATVTGKNELLGKYTGAGCINTNNNLSKYDYATGPGPTAPTAPTVTCS